MSRRSCIIGNWKMNGTRALVETLVAEVMRKGAGAPEAEVVLCLPATLLAHAAAMPDFPRSSVRLGAQDCHPAASGAHTGELSAAMLAEAGCAYALVGHSERRTQFGEDDALVRAKAEAALAAGLRPVICIGESLEIRERGDAEGFVAEQMLASLPGSACAGWGGEPWLIAYEPVWAIGTGKVASLADIEAMHAHLLAVLDAERGLSEGRAAILYGGSVKGDNAGGILDLRSVGGVLVGGASLDPAQFGAIVDAVSSSRESMS